jgi:hypothetical protein
VHNKQDYCNEAVLYIAEKFHLPLIQTTKDEFLQLSKLNTPRGRALIKRKRPYNFIMNWATPNSTNFTSKLSS